MNKPRIISTIITLIAVFLVTLFLRTEVFKTALISGDSMNPTLQNHESVWLDLISYRFDEPEYGDIVVCHYSNSDTGEYFVKRVIGKPGDIIEEKGGRLYRNGEDINGLYWDNIDITLQTGFKKIMVPKDSYFVVGDNVNNSMDSRIVGPISSELIVGKATNVVWPLERIRYLY